MPKDAAAPPPDSGPPEGGSPDTGASDAGPSGPDVTDLGYEQARDELVDIVARLESGQVGLEESMRLWERGEALAAHCATWLDRAEERLSGTED